MFATHEEHKKRSTSSYSHFHTIGELHILWYRVGTTVTVVSPIITSLSEFIENTPVPVDIA